MATFGQLRSEVLKRTGSNMFSFRKLSEEHNDFWNRMNDVEYQRGYKRGEYEQPGTPALCDMDLLSKSEFDRWLQEFALLPKVSIRRN